MPERPYLTYYAERGIIPVRQDISDLNGHLNRRRALYRHLGVQPLTLKNRRILEFGPGTGDNALFIASCAPEMCVLVDGNPASIRAISEKLDSGLLPRHRFEPRMSEIRDYADDRRFDVVLCEGVLPGQDEPEAFLSHVASFAGDDGIVIITTMSAPSVLAEVCRRVLKPILTAGLAGSDPLNKLTDFFKPDLLSLPGMSRKHEDWVLDNVLHPWPARFMFTIPEAINVLDHAFDLLGTSPSFINDWRWYKAIPCDVRRWNGRALDEYERWAPYLLDYRVQPGAPIVGMTARLDAACSAAMDIQHEIWHHDALDQIPRFADAMRAIHNMIVGVLPETALAITDFLKGLERLMDGEDNPGFGTFRSWFGRGQQYVSFTRR